MPILRPTPMKRKQRRKLARIRTSPLGRLDRQFELMFLIRRASDESELGVACRDLWRIIKKHKGKRKQECEMVWRGWEEMRKCYPVDHFIGICEHAEVRGVGGDDLG